MKQFHTEARSFTQRHKEDLRQRLSLCLCVKLCAFVRNCFLLLVLFAFSAVAQTPGLAELKKGDYDNAFKLLSAHVAANPNDVVAQRALLRVYLETGRYTDLEVTAKRFLKKSPPAGAVHAEFGTAEVVDR